MSLQVQTDTNAANMASPTTDPWIDSDGVKDLVSIIVPTCNRAPLLRETLFTLTRQTYRPLQITVVGDGVIDNTPDIVEEVREQADAEIEIEYITQERSGGPAARNRGALLAKGEFIIFMDDDDLATKDFVAARVEALQSSGGNLAFGVWQTFVLDEQRRYQLLQPRGLMPTDRESAWASFISSWDLLLQGCVIRRSLVAQAGPWNEHLHKSQDLDYKARLFGLDCEPVFCEKGTIYYRIHDESISVGVSPAKLESYVEVLAYIEQMGMRRDDYPRTQELLADYFWMHAIWLYGRGDFSRGFGEIKRAKRHSQEICRRKGLVPRLLDRMGLEIFIGPAYYTVSRLKKSLGFSKRKYIDTRTELLRPDE